MKRITLIVIASLAFLFIACDRNSADYVNVVPGDSYAVVRINPAALEKGGIDLSSIMDDLRSSIGDEVDFELPYKGIDLQSDLFAFISPGGRRNHCLGLAFGLSDVKEFAASCSKSGRVRSDGAVNYLTSEDEVSIAWSGKAGLMLAGLDDQDSDDLSDMAVGMLSGQIVPGGPFSGTESYASLMSVSGPVAGILNSSFFEDEDVLGSSSFEDILDELRDEDRKLYRALKSWDFSDLALLFGISLDGDVMGVNFDLVSPRGSNDANLAEFSAMYPSLKSSSLSAFSSSSEAGVACGVSGPALFRWLRDNSESIKELDEEFDDMLDELDIRTGLNLEKLVGSLDGTLTMGFNGMIDDEVPDLTVSIPAGGIYDDAIAILKDAAGDELFRSGNGWAFDLDGSTVSIGKAGNDITLSTSRSGSAGGGLPAQVVRACTGKKAAAFADVDGMLRIVSDLSYDDDGVRAVRKYIRKYIKDCKYLVVTFGEF